MAKGLNCDIVVSKFEFKSRQNVYFFTNTLGKYMNYQFLECYSARLALNNPRRLISHLTKKKLYKLIRINVEWPSELINFE